MVLLLLGVPSNGQDTAQAECYAIARCLGTHFTADFTGNQSMCCDSGVSRLGEFVCIMGRANPTDNIPIKNYGTLGHLYYLRTSWI